MKNLKIEKDKTYTYEELKKIFDEAMIKTINDPTNGNDLAKDDAHFQLSMMMSGVLLLNTMKSNMFEGEK